MASSFALNCFVLVMVCAANKLEQSVSDQLLFDQNYFVSWGGDHAQFVNQGTDFRLSIDQISGAGFASKLNYSSGLFHMMVKIPNEGTSKIVTTFYLISEGPGVHDELDFEYLGNNGGENITLQTNVFVDGNGGREQKIHLWFDPSADFHKYQILWNPHQVVFLVDDIPIRVFKNLTKRGTQYQFPSQPSRIHASVWHGDWAGNAETNWTLAPFFAYYRGFDIDGCSPDDDNSDDIHSCSSPSLWWNGLEELNATQLMAYENVKKNYMIYDYCSDRTQYPDEFPPECDDQD